MKVICCMFLLIFGASSDGSTSDENYFYYNTTKLRILEKHNTLECLLENNECYAECTFVNLTLNSDIMKVHRKNEPEVYEENGQIIIVFSDGERNWCNVTNCEAHKIINLIIVSSSFNDLKNLKRPTQIKRMCSKLFASDTDVIKTYIRAEKKYIDFLMSLQFNGTTKNYDLEDFNMSVVKMDMMNTTGDGFVQIPAPKTPGYGLPLDVFLPTKPFVQQKVGILTYPLVDIFINDPKTVLKSKVIRVETVGHEIKKLSEQLFIKFTVNSSGIITTGNQSLQCLFYNVDASAGLEWDNMGSFTDLENFNSNNTVICSYDHMTPFAVLLVDMNVTQIDSQQWKILSTISYIGCGLSSFFSAVTIFRYTFMKSSDRDVSIRIHVSLSVANFLLNTSFLFTDWAATWSEPGACVFIAVIIQYSLLSCFSWMAIEALHLYLLLLKVFNTYIKHYMIKLSLFGWGLPAVLVGGSLSVYGVIPFYGTSRIKLSNTNTTMNFCWITDIDFLYGMNVTYFSITFLFNTSILVAVMRQISKLRCMKVRGRNLPSCRDICTVLGLTLLLGMTWGLAFFTSGYINYPILYLFCIFNSLQGLFLFLWVCTTIKMKQASQGRLCVQDKTC